MVLFILLQLDILSVTQFPEIVISGVFGGQDVELLPRSGEGIAIHPQFNHEGLVRGSSYFAGGVLSAPFFDEESAPSMR